MQMSLEAAPYGGARFPVEARLDGRIFVGFHLDVGIGDAVMEPLEVIEARLVGVCWYCEPVVVHDPS